MGSTRVINILLRTAHIAAAGVLLGGHAFRVDPDRLLWSLGLTIGTGAALAAVEAGPRLLWFHQGRGLMTLGKLVLMAGVLVAWDWRLPILLAVVVLASVGSHMPARFRYYSVIYKRVIPCGSGPGTSQLAAERCPAEEPLPPSDSPTVCRRCDHPATFHVTNLGAKDYEEMHLCEDHARDYLTRRETS
jgi:hypothetical protein